ncbi:MAG: hypothetical protein COA78_32335 [Blastopirellula sp.]|nr:MAG: hypothetical protein COA78_32335 [Blastopirellula sp.]
MKAPHIANRNTLSRRHFLRGAGAAAISLPVLDAMTPVFGTKLQAAGNSADQSPKRFVAMCGTLGFHTPHLFPEKTGRDYELTPYLKMLEAHRNDFTVISGLAHPDQQGNNGHATELTWLTAAQRPGLAGFKNTISLDQLMAQKIGIQTRYPFLALSTSGRSISWTSSGVEIPGETSPARLFKALFVNGTEKEVAAEVRNINRGRSILDTVLGEAKKLDQTLGQRDKEKLSEYLASVRDLELRLQQSQDWSTKIKPDVNQEIPRDIAEKTDAIGKQRLMYDMMALALQTDSTRTMTFQLSGMNAVPQIPGVASDWHNLSHHGRDQDKIDELKLIEAAQFTAFNEFLTKLKSIEENGKSLLDHTAVLFGSNLGNASSHSSRNLPIVVAGGGYKHGNHISHDLDNNTRLSNLYVSFAQRMGLEIDQFGTSDSAGIKGLDIG